MPFDAIPLPYAFDALEPVIDARTVEIHYTKHHATYLKNCNAAMEKFPDLAHLSIEEVLANLSRIPEEIRTAVRNNGGGFYNHNIYWGSMAPNAGGAPVGKLAVAIQAAFGGVDVLRQEMEKSGLTRFGSGYAWLSCRKDGSLLIHSTANQDCPLADGLTPIIVVDVWEHAYYLHYQNRRADYLAAWWDIVNWQEAERRYLAAL
jgi:Fe-Mn family superoxide dismutase